MKGYTILELMVVIGVITALSLIAFVGIRGAAEREELVAASRQLVGDLISAQNKASSGKNKAGFEIVRANATSYKTYVFKYSYDSCSGDEIECGGDYCDDCPSGSSSCTYCREEVSESSFASPQVEISDSFSVYFFRPPNIGRALITGGAGPDLLEITLRHTKLGFEKKVVVSGAETVQIYEE